MVIVEHSPWDVEGGRKRSNDDIDKEYNSLWKLINIQYLDFQRSFLCSFHALSTACKAVLGLHLFLWLPNIEDPHSMDHNWVAESVPMNSGLFLSFLFFFSFQLSQW